MARSDGAQPEGSTLIASLKTLPHPAWILFLGTFLNKFGAFVIPFLALHLARQGYSMMQAGFALGVLAAAVIGFKTAPRIVPLPVEARDP